MHRSGFRLWNGQVSVWLWYRNEKKSKKVYRPTTQNKHFNVYSQIYANRHSMTVRRRKNRKQALHFYEFGLTVRAVVAIYTPRWKDWKLWDFILPIRQHINFRQRGFSVLTLRKLYIIIAANGNLIMERKVVPLSISHHTKSEAEKRKSQTYLRYHKRLIFLSRVILHVLSTSPPTYWHE